MIKVRNMIVRYRSQSSYSLVLRNSIRVASISLWRLLLWKNADRNIIQPALLQKTYYALKFKDRVYSANPSHSFHLPSNVRALHHCIFHWIIEQSCSKSLNSNTSYGLTPSLILHPLLDSRAHLSHIFVTKPFVELLPSLFLYPY